MNARSDPLGALQPGTSADRSHESRVAHLLERVRVYIVDEAAHCDRVRPAGRNPGMVQNRSQDERVRLARRAGLRTSVVG